MFVRKSISFNGKKHVIRNISKLDRHSTRYAIHTGPHAVNVELTSNGKKAALKKGEKLPKNFVLTVYHSPTKRTRDTAKLILQGHKQKGGKSTKLISDSGKQIRDRSEISIHVTKDLEGAARMYKELGSKRMSELWLNGKLGSMALPAQEVADKIIKNRFGLLVRATKKGINGRIVINVTHDFILQSVLVRLFGKRFANKVGVPKPNQGITLYHTNEGKVIAEYAKQKKDVTKIISEIIRT